MASYTISPIWGAGAQLFDNSGNVLTGGKIYTYLAGTTTPATTYTNPIGTVANSNPIIANSAGRLTNEIWFPVSGSYKFVLKDANDVLLATYDNIPPTPQPPIVNDASSVAYEFGYEVTAGGFTIGATYLITSVGTTDFVAIGAAANVTGIYFTATGVGSGTGTAEYSRTVQAKLRETISVTDFGADATGSVSSVSAIQAAVNTGKNVFFPSGTYLIDATITVSGNSQTLFGDGINSRLVAPANVNGFTWFDTGASANANIEFTGLFFIGNGTPRMINGNTGNDYVLSIQNTEAVRVANNKFEDCFAQTQAGKAVWVWAGSQNVMVVNNFFTNNGGQDVNFYGSNGSVYRCTAMNNIHFNTQGECYEVEGRAGLTIAGYEVYDCTFIGNQIRSSIPTITAAGSHGFLCIGGRGIKYIGNTVNRRGENGISLIGCQNVLIEGNQFQDLSRTGRNGILMNTDIFGVTGSNYAVQIVNNTFANGIDNTAINCHTGDTASISNRVIITNNQISNATTGIATGYVQDVTIADNTIDNATVTTPVSIGTGTSFQKGKLDNIDTTGVLVMPYVAKTFGFSDISGAYTFDISTGTTTFLHTLTGNVTSIAHVGVPKIGMEVTLVFNQGGAFTLPAAGNWTNIELAGLTAPVMTAIPGRKDVIKFVWNGTRWTEISRASNVGG